MNLATVIVLLVIAAMVVVALVSLHKGKGGCTCGDKKSSCSGCTADCPLRR